MFTGYEYKQVFSPPGDCIKGEPPPSSEDKICEKFHEKIKKMNELKNKNNTNGKDFDDNFVKQFLINGPTESLLIPTEEIRFESFFLLTLSFKEDYAISEQKPNLLLFY